MDEHLTDFIIQIKTSLASIETKVDGILDQLKNHENRILELEHHIVAHSTAANMTVDSKFLGKCLLITLGIIATLTGAGGLIVKIFGN